jgi:hypothetical protein
MDFDKKMGWATFRAIFSQTQLVTLLQLEKQFPLESTDDAGSRFKRAALDSFTSFYLPKFGPEAEHRDRFYKTPVRP